MMTSLHLKHPRLLYYFRSAYLITFKKTFCFLAICNFERQQCLGTGLGFVIGPNSSPKIDISSRADRKLHAVWYCCEIKEWVFMIAITITAAVN